MYISQEQTSRRIYDQSDQNDQEKEGKQDVKTNYRNETVYLLRKPSKLIKYSGTRNIFREEQSLQNIKMPSLWHMPFKKNTHAF